MKYTVSLKSNRDFRRLYSRGKSAAGSYVVVYAQKNRENVNKVGITVSKKLGGAVVRNRVRRRIREAYRGIEDLLEPGRNIVIVSRSKSVSADFKKLQAALLECLAQTGCKKKP